MFSFIILTVIVFGQENGSLTVNSDQNNLAIYLEGELIGRTPLTNYALKTGEYSISLFDSKTIENEYWNLRTANLFRKMSSIWQLSRIDAATKRITILPNQTTKIYFYNSRINRAPTFAKLAFGGCIGGIFGLGILTGVLIASLAK